MDADETRASDVVPPRLPQSQHGHPTYPEGADGRAARVLLQITIDERGVVEEATVLQSDREGEEATLFEQAAVEFVRTLQFEPATQNERTVPARVRFEVLFHPSTASRKHTHEVAPHTHPARPHTHGSPPGDRRRQPATRLFAATAEVSAPHQAASSADIQGEDLRLRPYASAGDLLNAGAGFYVIQHAGGGKAHQYFLRGFDADHGTDVAMHVDGIPVNHVSHGHGQGYTDLQWVIPELVERLEVRKGPYFASYGDFATAGAINLVLRDEPARSSFALGGGRFGSFRGVAAVSPRVEGIEPLVAAEVYGTNGPFENKEELRRFNLFSRVGKRWADGTRLAVTLTGHASSWNASGQVPLREVRAGTLDRFGTLDPNEGGSTQRHGVYATLRLPTDKDPRKGTASGSLELTSWLTYYQFALYSNFTFFSGDPVQGDMIRQGDSRWMTGFRGAYTLSRSLGPVRLRTRAGMQLRFDDVRTTLDDAPMREVVETRVDADIAQASLSLFADEEIKWRWLQAVLGVRADYFGFSVRDRLRDPGDSGPANSGEKRDVILSPKATVILTPIAPLELFLNFGLGFHSNDARGVVRRDSPATPLTRARGYEAGARVRLFDRLTVSAAVFGLDLESETVWVGDEGTTEARGSTRRVGLETQAHLSFFDWLSLETDATWTDSTFVDNPANADAVALAPTLLLDSGLVLRHKRTGLSGRLGLLYIADRPATEDRFLEAEGFHRVDASVMWETERFALSLNMLNLTQTDWRQAQFATTSRLPDETGPSSCPAGTRAVMEDGSFVGCQDIHFSPGWPFHVMATGTVFF